MAAKVKKIEGPRKATPCTADKASTHMFVSVYAESEAGLADAAEDGPSEGNADPTVRKIEWSNGI